MIIWFDLFHYLISGLVVLFCCSLSAKIIQFSCLMVKWINSACINRTSEVQIFSLVQWQWPQPAVTRWVFVNIQLSDCTGMIEAQWPAIDCLYTAADAVGGCVCVWSWTINGETTLSLYKPKEDVIPLQLFYFDICGCFVCLSLWLASPLPPLLPTWCIVGLNYSGGELL